MDLDLELSRMMEESVTELSVPVAVIVAESKRRGRRLRLARRLRVAGAALTVVVLGAVGANLGLSATASRMPAHTTGPAGAGVASTGSVEPSGSVEPTGRAESTPTPVRTPMLNLPAVPAVGRSRAAGTPSPDSATPFTPAQVYRTLVAVLPTDVQYLKTPEDLPGPLPAGTVGVVMKYVDGTGEAATVEVTMSRSEAVFPKDGNAPAEPPFQCAETVMSNGARTVQGCQFGFLADGSWEMVEENDAIVPGLRSYRVRLWRDDGTVLEFTEFNGLHDAADPTGSASNRTVPPISLDVWRAAAESYDWRMLSFPRN
ncbi:hypothetical protein ACIQF6_26800 [Kitasatospora sp. NPDC092948]|uniref:hypothetical protein n=1 Tax=Kitasatospora sp. NPDC092948 TaxID=3364088 RepID=UPI003821C83A